MATRRRKKNVEAGFFNATGFHPIRASRDYDSERLFDSENEPRKAKKKKPAARKKNPSAAAVMPRNKWVSGQVMITSAGKVQFKTRAVKKNPAEYGVFHHSGNSTRLIGTYSTKTEATKAKSAASRGKLGRFTIKAIKGPKLSFPGSR